MSIRGFPRLRASQVRRVPLGAVSPLGDRVVPGCVMGACLGRCDFPMTERCNSRLGFSHKAIALIHCFTSKAMRTPTL